MEQINSIWRLFLDGFQVQGLSTAAIAVTLAVVTVLAAYEFLIYRFVSKRSFYAKQFNIALAVLPYFIATIIMTLQSSLVITLGTIGALAIIRFRTAVKDPVDMVYLLWSIHTGITVGSGLYELAVLTSLVVTVVLLVLDRLPMARAPYLLAVHAEKSEDEQTILALVGQFARGIRVKSRSYSSAGLDLIIELRCRQQPALSSALTASEAVSRFTLIAHDSEDVIH